MILDGATPDEVYFGHPHACRAPRLEPRPAWPRASPGAKPRVLVKGQPGVNLDLIVEFLSRRHHLPRVSGVDTTSPRPRRALRVRTSRRSSEDFANDWRKPVYEWAYKNRWTSTPRHLCAHFP